VATGLSKLLKSMDVAAGLIGRTTLHGQTPAITMSLGEARLPLTMQKRQPSWATIILTFWI